MRQTCLKASWGLGWGSSDYVVGLGGQGGAPFLVGVPDRATVVLPLAGTFRHFVVYSPAGAHPNYTCTLMVNGVATALSCHLADTDTITSDRTHEVAVGAGDRMSCAVVVSPFGAGTGYPLNFSLEFEGAAQFYAMTGTSGSWVSGAWRGGGALGNGIEQDLVSGGGMSNTYSICTTPGTLTGLRLHTFTGAPGANGWIGYLAKNGVLQDGTGGTVNTACALTGAGPDAVSTFALPIAVTDRLAFNVVRTGANAPFALTQVTIACTFLPADPEAFMACGGNNDAASTGVDWKWVQSQQISVSEAVAQCPIGPRDVVVRGLYVQAVGPPGVGKSIVYTLRRTGTDTAATCTIADLATSCQITGLAVPYRDGDFLDLQLTPVGSPGNVNSVKWGLALGPPPPIPPPPPGTIDPIRRLRQAPVLWDGAEGKRLKFPGFELLTEAGGPRDTDVAMPIVLQWSDDGGHSWGHEHRNEGARIGEHRYRYRWLRLGQARNRVFRVVCSADAKVVFIDALLSPDPVQGSS